MSKQTDLINIPDAITVDGTKVGIGTTSPTLPLDIVSNAAADALKIRARPTSDDYGTLTFYNNAGTTKWADIQSNVAKDLRFYTNGGTERMRILSGGGITFNGDTAAANALDDYEEGTWTPVVAAGSATYAYQRGTYTKIGRTVYIHMFIKFSSVSSSGSYDIIAGLPFTAKNDLNYSGLASKTNNWNWGGSQTMITFQVRPNTAFISAASSGNNQNFGDVPTNNLTAGTWLTASGTYQTDA
jgi:hypothetical protein